MMDCMRVSLCRLCDSGSLDLLYAFTPTPPGDQYQTVAKPQTCYPLDVMRCLQCGAVQLADTVNPALIYPTYLYSTAHSVGLDAHFARYADSVIERVAPKPGGYVLDIGSNDGTLLKAFKARGWEVLGVDPAGTIADDATHAGIPTVEGFLTTQLASEIADASGYAAIITANHVLANVADLHDTIHAVKTLLAPNGTFVFETGYWPRILYCNLIDTIEHEHIHYFAVDPLRRLLARHDLDLVAVEEQPTKGGSLLGYVRHAGATRLDDSVDTMLAFERSHLTPADYQMWVVNLERLRNQVRGVVTRKRRTEPWVGYGAAVGSTLLLHHFELGAHLEALWDDNASRHGRVSPGLHLPVLPPNSSTPDRIVLLAWRYADRIIAAHPEHKGKWIQPLPSLRFA